MTVENLIAFNSDYRQLNNRPLITTLSYIFGFRKNALQFPCEKKTFYYFALFSLVIVRFFHLTHPQCFQSNQACKICESFYQFGSNIFILKKIILINYNGKSFITKRKIETSLN